jgi:hypothetical protein
MATCLTPGRKTALTILPRPIQTGCPREKAAGWFVGIVEGVFVMAGRGVVDSSTGGLG